MALLTFIRNVFVMYRKMPPKSIFFHFFLTILTITISKKKITCMLPSLNANTILVGCLQQVKGKREMSKEAIERAWHCIFLYLKKILKNIANSVHQLLNYIG